MKKILLLFLMVALVYSVDINAPVNEVMKKTESGSLLEIVRDWRVLTGIAIMISITLASLAFMIGRGFNMPDIEIWASGEIVQVFATAIIMIVFISVLSFLDQVVVDIVNGSNLGFICSQTENCGIKTANEYLSGLIDLAKANAKDAIKDQINAGKLMSLRFGAYLVPFIFPFPGLEAAYSGTVAPGYVFDMDRDAVIVDYNISILTGLIAQRYFINEIAYKVAPTLLFIGIVGRTFFVTRRLGGLLIAIAIGVMYVFPLMYVLNWLTLNVTLFGGNILVPDVEGECPAKCGMPTPLFIKKQDGGSVSRSVYTIEEAAAYLGFQLDDSTYHDKYEELKKAAAGEIKEVKNEQGKVLESCEWYASHSQSGIYCPETCRVLPYPQTPECTAKNETHGGKTPEHSCMEMPRGCKKIMLADPAKEPREQDESKICPDKCKVVPPLSNACIHCLDSPFYCRVAYKVADTSYDRPEGCDSTCIADNDAYKSCSYVIPDKSILEECSGCMFVPKAYTFNPPIYTSESCAAMCRKNPTGPPKISPSEFTKKSQEMMYGDDKIKGTAALMLPAYVLLILNVTVTLMFIKTFSPIIGGDVDIPGIAKIT